MNKNTGGPAFHYEPIKRTIYRNPLEESTIPLHNAIAEYTEYVGGITVRDFFAAKALQTILLDKVEVKANDLSKNTIEEHLQVSCEFAYLVADYMIKEREK